MAESRTWTAICLQIVLRCEYVEVLCLCFVWIISVAEHNMEDKLGLAALIFKNLTSNMNGFQLNED